jgi:SnoaL-like domain
METVEAARRWADEWARGWREHDPERIAALYAEDASFRTSPFRDPQDPKKYAEWAFSQEDSVECDFDEPIVFGDRATVEWWAVTQTGVQEETLAGVSLLRFDEKGLVVEERGYWHAKPGRHELS